MRIDQPDDADTGPRAWDAAEEPTGGTAHGKSPEQGKPGEQAPAGSGRTEYAAENRARVDATYRSFAVEQGCARVAQIEREAVTPGMRQIEAEDPSRNLAGLDHRLKGKDRLSEKVTAAMTERGRSASEAFASIKDAIRYTFCHPDDRYTAGVYADCDRLHEAGFERVERRNLWPGEEYKGINSRWREPGKSRPASCGASWTTRAATTRPSPAA